MLNFARFVQYNRILLFSVLAFALYFVATNPEVDKKVNEEIQTVLSEKDLNATSFAEFRYVHKI